MAATTTGFNACDVAVWIDNSGGVPTDISGSSNNLDVNLDNNLGDFVVFQEQWPKRLECGKDAQFTLRVVMSSTADEGWDLLKDWFFTSGSPGDRTLTFYGPSKNVGSDKFECEAKLENLTWVYDRGEPSVVLVTAILKPNGAVTHSDVAT